MKHSSGRCTNTGSDEMEMGTAMDDSEIADRIEKLVKVELPRLTLHLREWAEQHLVAPRQVTLSINENGQGKVSLWLVTDHIGHRDSSYRVVFDVEQDKFGLEGTRASGVEWYMGLYGGFAETIENM